MVDRADWLAARRRGVGGSDVAPILGLSKYRTAFGVWLDKTGQAPADKPRWIFARGHAMEAGILATYAQATGRDVQPNAECMVGAEPWQRGTPDGYVASYMYETDDGFLRDAGDGLIDAKSSIDWKAWGPEGTYYTVAEAEAAGAASLDVLAQGQWYLHITGREWIDFVVALLPWREEAMAGALWESMPAEQWEAVGPQVCAYLLAKSDVKVYRIYRDQPVIDGMVAACGAWWDRHVVQGIAPEVDGSDEAGAWVREQATGQDAPKVSGHAEGEILDALNEAVETTVAADEAESRKAAARQRLSLLLVEKGWKQARHGGRSASLTSRGVLRVEVKR